MFVQIRKWTLTEGNTDKIIERFTRKPEQGPSLIEQQEGFLGRELLVKDIRRGEEEVLMLVRWESKEAWKSWEKSPEHIAGHKKKIKENGAKPPKPDYIIAMEHGSYTVIE
ncbi:monooxygenase [Planococcus glaciei]|uniref:Antibiotic biosynthesis monooxygenase n=1 Tax=Planococcus notacanthi TaxID=3035188 RepID=A0ABT7ZH48_9BACL|nr:MULTISPECIES: antibiotic biosynthesis monooxygenase [Terrabacteria group]KOF10026.1 monooxygenase [Planococcus glaciei]MBX0316294.1 antibiotic biosynthesis monooxygenase [Planococcus glaciei]MDN3426481.1 antibiotic biosynthesis monooxygenase [Planococcus sp. APC 4016]MDN3500836.1 antibiotic biosynthesis monooxygenase [Microbacterium sp. APC 3898]